jgi:hypothetical protein
MAFQFMACRGLRSSLFIFFVIFGGASVFLFSWFSGRAFGQGRGSIRLRRWCQTPAAVKVTATAAADSTTSGSATVSVETPTGLGTSQFTVTATAAGGTAHGDLVTLIVQ